MQTIKGFFGYGNKTTEPLRSLDDGDEYNEKVQDIIKMMKSGEKLDKIEKKYRDYFHVHLVTAALDILANTIKENQINPEEYKKKFAKLCDSAQNYAIPGRKDKKPALTYPVKLIFSIVKSLKSSPPNLQDQALSIFRLSFSLLDAALNTAANSYKQRLTKQNSELLNNALHEVVEYLKGANRDMDLVEQILNTVVDYYRKKLLWHDHPILLEAVVFCYAHKAARANSQDQKGFPGSVLDTVKFLVTWQHLKQEHILEMFKLLHKRYSRFNFHNQISQEIKGVSKLYLQLHWTLFMQCFGLIFDKWEGCLSSAPEIVLPLQNLFIQVEAARSFGNSETEPWSQYTQCRKMISEFVKQTDKHKLEFGKYWKATPDVSDILKRDLEEITEGRLSYSLEVAYCLWPELNLFASQFLTTEEIKKLSNHVIETVSRPNDPSQDKLRSSLLRQIMISCLNPISIEKLGLSVPAVVSLFVQRIPNWVRGCSSSYTSDLVKEIQMLLMNSKASFDYTELKKISLELLKSNGTLIGSPEIQAELPVNLDPEDLANLKVHLARFAVTCWHHEIFVSERSPETSQAIFKELSSFFNTGIKDLIESLEIANAYKEVTLVKAMTSSLFWSYAKKFGSEFNRTAKKMMEKPNDSKLIKIFYHIPGGEVVDAEKEKLDIKTHKTLRDWWLSSCDLLLEESPHFEYTLHLLRNWLRPELRLQQSKVSEPVLQAANHLVKCGYRLLTNPNILQPNTTIDREKLWLQLFYEWSYTLLELPVVDSEPFTKLVEFIAGDSVPHAISALIAPKCYNTMLQVVEAWKGYLQQPTTYEALLCLFCKLLDRWRRSQPMQGQKVALKDSKMICKVYLRVFEQISWRLLEPDELSVSIQDQKRLLARQSITQLDSGVEFGWLEISEADDLRREMGMSRLGRKGIRFNKLNTPEQELKLGKVCSIFAKFFQKPVLLVLKRNLKLAKIQKGFQIMTARSERLAKRRGWVSIQRAAQLSKRLQSVRQLATKLLEILSPNILGIKNTTMRTMCAYTPPSPTPPPAPIPQEPVGQEPTPQDPADQDTAPPAPQPSSQPPGASQSSSQQPADTSNPFEADNGTAEQQPDEFEVVADPLDL